MKKKIQPGAHTTQIQPTPVALACALLILGVSGSVAAQETSNAAAVEQVQAIERAPDTTPINKVTVNGIRTGIEAAISIKKNANSIVEAVSAEDIGKLPDSTVAESVSRLSGVTVQRDKETGKASQVSVRGLSPSFNGSLLNGREQASTGDNRAPEFELFPAELTGSVLVYKTPTATLVGQGLAATIDLRTLRPLEFGKRVMAASYRKERIGIDAGGEEGSGNRKTLSYIDQFADRTLGVSFGVTSFKQDNGDELLFDTWGGYAPKYNYNGAEVSVPGGFKSDSTHKYLTRDSATMTLQYRPNANFKSTVDLFYSYGTENSRTVGIEGAIALNAGMYDPDGVLSNPTIANGVATSGTFNNYKGDIRNIKYRGNDKFQSIGWNAEWKVGDWRLEGDVGHSSGFRHNFSYETTAGQPGNTPSSQLGSISWTGFNGSNFTDVQYKTSLDYTDRAIMKLTDVDGWGGGPLTPQAGYYSSNMIKDTLNTVRLTAHRELEWGPVVGAHFGVNATRRNKTRWGDGEGRLSVNGADGYASATMPGTETSIAGPVGIRVASFDPTGTLGSVYGLNTWVDATVLARDWKVKEDVDTLYGMADLDGKLYGVPYTGNVGVQVLRTRQTGQGVSVDQSHCTGNTVDTCAFSIVSDGDHYTNVLPSLNLAFDLGNEQVLRLGAGKQIARANMDNMRNGLTFGVPPSSPYKDISLEGNGGSPKLRPFAARSLDLSYEKYFANRGYVSGAIFFKKLDNYILNVPRLFDFAPYVSPNTALPKEGAYKGSTIGFLTQPTNGQGGTMHGIELAANMPFALLWNRLDGFGATLNYSYTDTNVTMPTSGFAGPNNVAVFAGDVSNITLPGLSRDVASMRLYFEKAGFQISYTLRYRSAYIGQIKDYRSDSQLTNIHSESIADVQASYEFQNGWLKGLSVFAQGNNLTNTPFNEFTKDPNTITQTKKYGKFFAAGVTYKF